MFLDFIKEYPFILAFILGLVPALIWLWFWLKEDRHHEPSKMITLAFLGGMVAVMFSLPLQEKIYYYFNNINDHETLAFTLWAMIEELAKFGFVWFIALRNKALADEPVDDIIYLIVSALGFVTFENTLFLIDPIKNGEIINTIIHGNLRFIGASLLHTMSSATIGICMALSYYKNRKTRVFYTLFGILMAVVLHTTFNLFIIRQSSGNIFFVFGMVWVSIVILLLLFEKVKHIKDNSKYTEPRKII